MCRDLISDGIITGFWLQVSLGLLFVSLLCDMRSGIMIHFFFFFFLNLYYGTQAIVLIMGVPFCRRHPGGPPPEIHCVDVCIQKWRERRNNRRRRGGHSFMRHSTSSSVGAPGRRYRRDACEAEMTKKRVDEKREPLLGAT